MVAPDADLLASLRRLNALRASRSRTRERERLEAEMETRFGVSCRLVVYGTLAPGESNADQLAPLEGIWRSATVRGARHPRGWGAVTFYPAFRWDEAGAAIPVQLFESGALPGHWRRLDRFEGPTYGRVLVPVYLDAGWTVANVYEARET
ncbi:MAG: gamma-glutamylcyclotransferase family protein [Rhodothermales bacterium]